MKPRPIYLALASLALYGSIVAAGFVACSPTNSLKPESQRWTTGPSEYTSVGAVRELHDSKTGRKYLVVKDGYGTAIVEIPTGGSK